MDHFPCLWLYCNVNASHRYRFHRSMSRQSFDMIRAEKCMRVASRTGECQDSKVIYDWEKNSGFIVLEMCIYKGVFFIIIIYIYLYGLF